ncbi:MAG: mRNA surveillance protein pelota [Methanobacterium sp.]|jgi:protein pelota
MRIVHQDTKKGFIELIPETLDDLWHLSHIIKPGDLVSSRTTRRIQDSTGERIRSDRGIKKTFFMGIRVEGVSFHKYTGKLRATGIIEKGPEDLVPLGTHHTIELKLKNPVKITKEKWSRWTIKRLKTAVDSSKKPSAIIVAIEDDVADLGVIKQYGIDYYGPIVGGISGKKIIQKDRGKNITNFYNEVAKTLQGFEDIHGIVIAGPGFTKGDFYDFLSEKYPELAKISGVENTGTGGRVGIQEVLKKGTIEQMAAEGRIAQEMRLINRVLEEIGKSSNMVTYGKSDVENASNAGAVETLLVLDNMVRREEIEKIMNIVESTGGKVMVVSSEHEGGKQLQALGGIAGLLRYSIR